MASQKNGPPGPHAQLYDGTRTKEARRVRNLLACRRVGSPSFSLRVRQPARLATRQPLDRPPVLSMACRCQVNLRLQCHAGMVRLSGTWKADRGLSRSAVIRPSCCYFAAYGEIEGIEGIDASRGPRALASQRPGPDDWRFEPHDDGGLESGGAGAPPYDIRTSRRKPWTRTPGVSCRPRARPAPVPCRACQAGLHGMDHGFVGPHTSQKV